MYSWRSAAGSVDLAFTDRYGGAGTAAELDLALEDETDPGVRTANLRAVVADFAPGSAVADMRQVHGADVVVVGSAAAHDRPSCDALVTAEPDVTLVVRVADCVPVLLADADAGVVGAAHAGRLGVSAGVVTATVERMQQLGAAALTGWIGPHVCGSCYEVPTELQDEIAALVPEARSTTSWGTPALDLGAAVRAQLVGAGVRVVDVARCTRESPDLFSYRRDGRAAGRFAGLVRRRR